VLAGAIDAFSPESTLKKCEQVVKDKKLLWGGRGVLKNTLEISEEDF
jgi:hypothetical protein